MFGFLLKKSFFDLWDNMIYTFLMNVVSLFLVFGATSVLFFLPPTIGFFALIPLFLGIGVLLGALSYLCGDLVFGRRPGIRELGGYIKDAWRPGLMVGAFLILFSAFSLFGVPFYLGLGIFGWVVLSLVFWFALFTLLALQFFFPLGKQLRNTPGKLIKKSYLILLDNTGVALLMGFVSIAPLLGLVVVPALGTSGVWGFVLSICGLLLLFFPGIGGMLLFQQNALKLIMKKYDYLETHPGVTKKELSWDELLYEEREVLGHRTLKNLIFPWKD